MTSLPRPQRIRDPLHNLIEFGTDDFEHALWRVIQTRPFQRLRRIRQLGFSELVYPGATHTRFAHSVGVFHTARRLMQTIKDRFHDTRRQYESHWAQVALAASLVHDLGHGMFSHAFEEVGKELKRNFDLDLKMVKHEHVTELLIGGDEVAGVLNGAFGAGFAKDVADLIGRGYPKRIYDSVVSSQFDADRLDYMQRDRLMTGVQNSGIDLTWLMANLETGAVEASVDEEKIGEVETFVLGPKAIHAAETYILGLFQLYPTVYFHKATRGAETLFTALMVRLVTLAKDGSVDKTGLPGNHPFVRFAAEPDRLENVLALDDAVFWGALPLLAEAHDPMISQYARRLWERRLLRSIDIRERLLATLPAPPSAGMEIRKQHMARIARLSERIKSRIADWSGGQSTEIPRVLIDQARRSPYKRFQDSNTPLNQIHIRVEGDKILDVAERSPVVAGLEPFDLFRVYVDRHDGEAERMIVKIIEDVIKTEVSDDGQA